MSSRPQPAVIGSLVDRQMQRWRLQHPDERQKPHRPCVAISRQPLSGGNEVGHEVADRLDYGFFGREIVHQIANEAGVRDELVAGLDERVLSGIDRFVADTLRLRSFRESDYWRHVAKVAVTLGRRGRSVLVGRGMSYMFDPGEVLRVRLVAPTELRIERLGEEAGIAPDEARERLAEIDEQHRRFVDHHFHVREEDAEHYDLVVNTASFGAEGSAQLIVEALDLRFPEKPDA